MHSSATSVYLFHDHPVVRLGLSELLRLAGYAVAGESDDVSHAMAALVSCRPDVLVLASQVDRGISARFIEELQRLRCAARVLVVSAVARPGDIATALRAGASGYVMMDATTGEVGIAIDAVALGGRYLGRSIDAARLQRPTNGTLAAGGLSPREQQILVMVASGRSSKHIGRELDLSIRTVETHRRRTMCKLGLHDVSALVRWAIRERFIEA